MRKLKFRVYDTEFNKYHWDQGDWSLGIKSGMVRGIYGEEFPEFIIEQWTGLLDKNGKEIYEGDQVDFWGGAGIIVFQEACFGIQYTNGDFFGIDEKVEVVGNIHENNSKD